MTTVRDLMDALDRRYPRSWAEPWDAVRLVLGDPERTAGTVLCAVDCVPETVNQAVAAGAGLIVAHHTAAGVDAYLCADLRHHPASEHLAAGGPALLDVAHWTSERPWLDDVAAWLRDSFPVTAIVSDLDTDPWTVHAASPARHDLGAHRPRGHAQPAEKEPAR